MNVSYELFEYRVQFYCWLWCIFYYHMYFIDKKPQENICLWYNDFILFQNKMHHYFEEHYIKLCKSQKTLASHSETSEIYFIQKLIALHLNDVNNSKAKFLYLYSTVKSIPRYIFPEIYFIRLLHQIRCIPHIELYHIIEYAWDPHHLFIYCNHKNC